MRNERSTIARLRDRPPQRGRASVLRGHRYTGYGDGKTGPGGGVAVGNGRILKGGNVVPLDTKPGDQVLFGKYAGTEIKLEGEELLVMREADIMAVLEE